MSTANNPFNVSNKVRMAIEQIARMRVAGIRDNIIAIRLGYTASGLARILALPEYQDFEEAVFQGHVSKMDEALAGKLEDMKKYFETAVPQALSTLFETCRQRRDLRAAMSAASEILDRDPEGTFSKKKVSLDTQSDAPSVSKEFLDNVTQHADGVAKSMRPN